METERVKHVYRQNFQCSKASNSETQSQMEFKLVRDFMPVLVICKFDKDPIKNEGTVVSTIFSPGNIFVARVIASIQIWPEIELVRDVMLVLVTCKFDEDLIKMKALSCPYLFRCSRASNSKVNGRIWPKFELI